MLFRSHPHRAVAANALENALESIFFFKGLRLRREGFLISPQSGQMAWGAVVSNCEDVGRLEMNVRLSMVDSGLVLDDNDASWRL